MTVLTRWEPLRDFSTLQDRMNRFSVSRTALKARTRH